jgi:hypothetical protein
MKFRFVFMGPDENAGRPDALPRVEAASAAFRFETAAGGMVRHDARARGESKFVPLANFVARIFSDRIIDDGTEPQRHFGLRAELADQTIAFSIPAVEFGRMGWVLGNLGPEAIVYPGQLQHARAAVQALSQGIRREHVFAHTGWRKIDGRWVYLHAGGAIGADGYRQRAGTARLPCQRRSPGRGRLRPATPFN